ncbi:serine hydrolase [Altericista sp. CCNU0014]|uniref:serine hydrolase n=1 Tax=Altericista sp. CCNU0014 TaxID=3082949 RepID=UPI00384BA91D
MAEYARKPLSVGQRRQLLKQRRQAAQKRVRQQSQNLHPQSLRPKSPIAKRRANATSIQSPEGLVNPRAQQRSVQLGLPTSRSSATARRDSQSFASDGQRTDQKATPSPRNRARTSRPQRKPNWIQNVLRLGFLGLGMSAMAGTALAILHPEPPSGTLAGSKQALNLLSPSNLVSGDRGASGSAGIANFGATVPVLNPGKELTEAKAKIQALAAAQKDLEAGMFFYNPENGAYLDVAGDRAFPAASTIKLPILVAFFQAIDAGQIRLDEMLAMRKELIASEAGVMQYLPVGTKFSALETADKMITISDNTATNMMIDRLGGMTALNQRFRGWGLTQTSLQNVLPDLKGTNTVTPKDLSTLMLKIGQGDLLTPRSRDLVLDTLRRTVTNTLLPPGLGEGATIAHKTGDIGSVVGDAGLVGMPNGQRYVAAIFVKRPHNDSRAQELIRQISKVSYQALLSSSKTASPPPTAAKTAP